MRRTPDSEATSGWWFVPELGMHLKFHERWRAEVWSLSDGLHTSRLRIYDHSSGAEWLDAFYPLGTCGSVPFQRADRFMLDGQMPGWGEWPSEPTSSGRVPMPACVYCHGPVSQPKWWSSTPGHRSAASARTWARGLPTPTAPAIEITKRGGGRPAGSGRRPARGEASDRNRLTACLRSTPTSGGGRARAVSFSPGRLSAGAAVRHLCSERPQLGDHHLVLSRRQVGGMPPGLSEICERGRLPEPPRCGSGQAAPRTR